MDPGNLADDVCDRYSTTMRSKPAVTNRWRKFTGFTLVELLVVIVIIAALSAALFLLARRGIESSNRARNVQQMRQIGSAVAMWAADHNNGEPMYFANGTGDYAEEGSMTGKDPKLSPGNPAKALYFRDDPSSSYVADHTVFFSGLATLPAPPVRDYDPRQVDARRPWGTFAWLYPSTTRLSPRQLAAMGGFSNSRIGREAYDNLIMANDYRGTVKARFKPHYHALFRDGSVRYIGDSAAKWNAWLHGLND